jgi:hypothetical protein
MIDLAKINDISSNTVPALKADISSNLAKINDVTNTMPAIKADVSCNLAKINDITSNAIPALQTDTSSNLSIIKDISSSNTVPAIRAIYRVVLLKLRICHLIQHHLYKLMCLVILPKSLISTHTIPAIESSILGSIDTINDVYANKSIRKISLLITLI